MFVSARGYSSICNLYSVHFTLMQTPIFLFSHCAKCLNIYISEGHQSHHTSDPTHSLWKDTMRGLNSEDVTYNLRNCWSQLKVWRCSLNSLPANLTGFEVKWTETRRWWWRARTAQWTIQRCREDVRTGRATKQDLTGGRSVLKCSTRRLMLRFISRSEQNQVRLLNKNR